MALIKGICKNYGECDLADSKEIQEVEKTNFVCEECGKPLFEVKGTKPRPIRNGKRIVLITVASLLLCGLILAVYLFKSSDGPYPVPDPLPPIDPIEVTDTMECEKIPDEDNGSTEVKTEKESLPTPLPSGRSQESAPPLVGSSNLSVPTVNIPDDLQDAINMLVNQSYSREARLNSIPNIINKFFESSAKVRTLGDTGITLDYENVNDFFRRIVLSQRIAEVQLLGTEMRNKITEISIQEINK